MADDIPENWWPNLLAHIPAEDPWRNDYVMVAERRGFDDGTTAVRMTISALVPFEELEACKEKLRHFSHELTTSGPHPCHDKDGEPYTPLFSVRADGTPSDQYEPLVNVWQSTNQTTLQPDQGFLMTYGLIPRVLDQDGHVHWDEPELPRHDIVTVSPPSIYDTPNTSPAEVKIEKDHLQDYLTIRNMALIQSYFEMRWGPVTQDIKDVLGKDRHFAHDFEDRSVHIGLDMTDKSRCFAQVWGARIIAEPGDAPISTDPLDSGALEWPGIQEPVTNATARALGMDYVYVRDNVLAQYEGDEHFTINPETGSVGRGGQWGVDFCDRVDRDIIRLEVRKLYEGNPPEVIQHWHSCAVAPPGDDAFPGILNANNVAKRTKRLMYGVITLSEVIAELGQALKLSPEAIVGTTRNKVDSSGWWSIPDAEKVARHAPLTLDEDSFLTRCLKLSNLVIERLKERPLRNLIIALGVPEGDISDYRTLKLLDLLIRMAAKAADTGLDLSTQGNEIYLRLNDDDAEPNQPLTALFAINDLRQLAGHNANDGYENKRDSALKRLGVDPAACKSGYGTALDDIYDQAAQTVEDATASFVAILSH